MKKIFLLSLISLANFTPQLHSISLAEYIQLNGMPQVLGSALYLFNKDLTDLTGLQSIPNTCRHLQ